MRNNYLSMLLSACFLLIASHADAQFRFGDWPTIGQTLTVDTTTGIATFLVHFNTNRPNSTWTQDSVITINFQKAQTNRGIQSLVFESDAPGAPTVLNDDFRLRRWNSNENPVHIHSIDSLEGILAKYGEKFAGTADSVKNVIWKPSASLFDVNGDPNNQALGTHPGQYKRVEYGFQFSFAGTGVTSDIEFEIDTYDEGNTGQTATYALVLALGSEGNKIDTIENFYVTGSGKQLVKVAEAFGLDHSAFSNEKVYIWVTTQGTGTPIERTSFDPTIVFDNIKVTYQLPYWVSPPAGPVTNTILGNMDDPLVAPIGVPTTVCLPLQTTSRYGQLSIVNDLQDRSVQYLVFPDSGGLKANDGSGNYTIDVPYTFVPGVFDPGTQQWSKASITVAAPDSGSVNDDLLFCFEATPAREDLHFARLELNSGTRIWYDFYMQGFEPEGNLLYIGAGTPDAIIRSDSVSIVQLEAAGYVVNYVDDNDVDDGGYDYSGYDAVVFGESTSSSRVTAFGTIDNFPLPAVILEPLAVRDDRWGWVTNRAEDFMEDRGCAEGTDKLEILNNTHYITREYENGEIIPWTTATCGSPEIIAAFGFNINNYSDGPIALAKNTSTAISGANLWAVPAGTTVGEDTVKHRMVIFGIHEFGIYGKDNDRTEYATEDFYNLLLRSVRWTLRKDTLEPIADLLYIGASGPDAVLRSDSISIAQLINAGYSVTVVDDNDVDDGGYDYSGYDAVVFGESTSSSRVTAFGTIDKYPAPVLMMEPLAVRTDRWGWIPNPDPGTFPNSTYPGFTEDRSCAEGTTQLQILDTNHYITQDYTPDTVVAWSSALCGNPETVFAFGFNVNRDMAIGIPLARNNSAAITDPNLWAIPAGATVTTNGEPVTTAYRTVLFGIHELGLYGKDADTTEYATQDFYNLMIRSVEWILGNGEDGEVVSTKERPRISQNILAYPNPASGQATLRFDLQSAGKANLSLVNMMGQRFVVFRDQALFSGTNEVQVNLSGFAPGMYVYQLEAEGKAFVGRLMIVE